MALALAGVVPARPAAAAEPKPSEERLTLEADIVPDHVSAPQTTIALCVQDVNRRAATNLALLSGDAWTFRIQGGCGTFFPLTSCPNDLTVNSAQVTAADLSCVYSPNSIVLAYVGTPKLLAFE